MATTAVAIAIASCSAAQSSSGFTGGGGTGTLTTSSTSMGTGAADAGPDDDGGIIIDTDGGDGGMCSGATTCAAQMVTCGPIGDGCGGTLDCGTCQANEMCIDGKCQKPMCTPKTCADQGIECGPAGDGCGNGLNCGGCTAPDTCGGGGENGKCGHMQTCTPKSCADQGIFCGPAGDLCGGQLNCGGCPLNQSCGGGGVSGVCGAPQCIPKTCADFSYNCGPAGDGCGGLLNCGTCNAPTTCGGAGQTSVCGVPPTCTNLCLLQVTCPTPNTTTTISGTVYAPNGIDPLLNALVYIPNAPVSPFTPGVSCDKCGAAASGKPLVSAVSDTAGKFTLKNVPVGQNIPIVIQLGRWRRQITIANVNACVDNPLPAAQTRLPKNKSEGDIPLMAFATGNVDALECVMRKIGIDDAEFTVPAAMGGTGRIHLFTGSGGGGATIGGTGLPKEDTLWTDPAVLNQYDMVLFPCQANEYPKPQQARLNMVNYANAGGRIFATHYSYVWFYNTTPFSSTAQWAVNGSFLADQTGFIDMTFPKGLALAQWLVNVGASTVLGQIPLKDLRKDTNGVVPPTQAWMTASGTPMHFTFNTPVGINPTLQCGRVLYDDFHVEGASASPTTSFPNECTGGTAMSPQEKLLEFMIFDLGSCVTPDIPTCTPKTCQQQGFNCGPAGDGCGNVIQCGNCPVGQTCGGGGTPSVCGTPSCTSKTCAQLGVNCGPAGDGCGNLLQCGTCPMGQTCGGGGMPGVCGTMSCTPKTCAQLGVNCGPAGDGCGGLLSCGNCPAGQTCGGGGMPGVCGGGCTPKTCAQLGYNCGPVGDGCGNIIQCGTCNAPQTCGGGGVANVCGGSGPG